MADLTTLTDVKAWLSPSPSSGADDGLLGRLITAASTWIQTQCGRQFASQAYTETRDGTGGARLLLRAYPVTAIATVTIDGQAIPAGDAVTTAGYYWSAGSEFQPTALMLNGYRFCRGLGNVTVAYTAGYAAIPDDLAQGAIELVAWRYRERDRVGMASKGMAGETTAFSIRDVPPSVATLIGLYRRVITP